MTVLVRAGVRFNGLDQQKIQIPGADLSRGQFDAVDFQGAELSGVNLTCAWIREANFSLARMQGVTFGARPLLKVTDLHAMVTLPMKQTIAMAFDNGKIKIVNPLDWSICHMIEGLKEGTRCLASPASPVSRPLLASGGQDNSVHIWDLEAVEETKIPLHTLSGGHSNPIDALTFSSDGGRLASASNRMVVVWDVASGDLIRTLDVVSDYRSPTIALSPDGQQLATGASKVEKITLWNVSTGVAERHLKGEAQWIAYSPFDHYHLVTSSSLSTLKFWDLQ